MAWIKCYCEAEWQKLHYGSGILQDPVARFALNLICNTCRQLYEHILEEWKPFCNNLMAFECESRIPKTDPANFLHECARFEDPLRVFVGRSRSYILEKIWRLYVQYLLRSKGGNFLASDPDHAGSVWRIPNKSNSTPRGTSLSKVPKNETDTLRTEGEIACQKSQVKYKELRHSVSAAQ